MLDTPEIVQLPAQRIAVLPLRVPRVEIRRVMEPGRRELLDAVAAQRIAVVGPWFTHHLREPGDAFDFEIGVPIAAPFAATAGMRESERPAGEVARAIYRGGYEGLAEAWGELMAWAAREGLAHAADLWETYLVGPEASPRPEHWRTELVRPLARPNAA